MYWWTVTKFSDISASKCTFTLKMEAACHFQGCSQNTVCLPSESSDIIDEIQPKAFISGSGSSSSSSNSNTNGSSSNRLSSSGLSSSSSSRYNTSSICVNYFIVLSRITEHSVSEPGINLVPRAYPKSCNSFMEINAKLNKLLQEYFAQNSCCAQNSPLLQFWL